MYIQNTVYSVLKSCAISGSHTVYSVLKSCAISGNHRYTLEHTRNAYTYQYIYVCRYICINTCTK